MQPVSFKATRAESDRIRAARGFASFKQWARENRAGARINARRKRQALVDALDREYSQYIAHNL